MMENEHYAQSFIELIIDDIESGKVTPIYNIDKSICQFAKSDLVYSPGDCISNSNRFAFHLKERFGNEIERIWIIEGIAIIPSQKLVFKHMWNKVILKNGTECEVDITRELYWGGVDAQCYAIKEHSDRKIEIEFSKLTTTIEEKYWQKHPESRPKS